MLCSSASSKEKSLTPLGATELITSCARSWRESQGQHVAQRCHHLVPVQPRRRPCRTVPPPAQAPRHFDTFLAASASTSARDTSQVSRTIRLSLLYASRSLWTLVLCPRDQGNLYPDEILCNEGEIHSSENNSSRNWGSTHSKELAPAWCLCWGWPDTIPFADQCYSYANQKLVQRLLLNSWFPLTLAFSFPPLCQQLSQKSFKSLETSQLYN